MYLMMFLQGSLTAAASALGSRLSDVIYPLAFHAYGLLQLYLPFLHSNIYSPIVHSGTLSVCLHQQLRRRLIWIRPFLLSLACRLSTEAYLGYSLRNAGLYKFDLRTSGPSFLQLTTAGLSTSFICSHVHHVSVSFASDEMIFETSLLPFTVL